MEMKKQIFNLEFKPAVIAEISLDISQNTKLDSLSAPELREEENEMGSSGYLRIGVPA